ncbi:non-heme iron oxygenase ferredoxin subunit [Paraburkholderia phytofirmans]|jgi:nitrite reductase/ring-hydroxylating ferredoxin subunit|uniref:non-heme iron oxygenase ferredoxin subunit n=1 Tax=Paraburkholderia sp. BL9I2N2 TaxID=1938809 RepID=UPI00105044CD|nr:non-heme iron oxygenase ferredoxin subunit [Paraburkholderia sp. BL9I2N2]
MSRCRHVTFAALRLSLREVSVSWLNVARLSNLTSEYPAACSVGTHRIAIYLVDGVVYATSNICTHQFALLSDGYQENGEIECPLHQGRFDVRTGKALCSPLTVDLATYEVDVRGDEVWVCIQDAGEISVGMGAGR